MTVLALNAWNLAGSMAAEAPAGFRFRDGTADGFIEGMRRLLANGQIETFHSGVITHAALLPGSIAPEQKRLSNGALAESPGNGKAQSIHTVADGVDRVFDPVAIRAEFAGKEQIASARFQGPRHSCFGEAAGLGGMARDAVLWRGRGGRQCTEQRQGGSASHF
jgi:hypothetical protein